MKLPILDLGPVFFPQVAVCFTEEHWDQNPRIKYRWAVDASMPGCCLKFDSGFSIIQIAPEHHTSFTRLSDTIAHEAFHASCHVFDSVGDSHPSEETQALLVGKIAGFVMTEYFRAYFARLK